MATIDMFENDEVIFDRVEIERGKKNKNRYFLRPVYKKLNEDSSIDEITITCENLHIDFLDDPDIEIGSKISSTSGREVTFNIFSNYIPKGCVYTSGEIYRIKRIKEPDPVEMTLEEIEKALGKKIKIITK